MSDNPVVLHGYKFSVYNRIARLVLDEKDVPYTTIEVDPFSDPIPPSYLKMHPFGRVPVLCHGAFYLYETVAITRYIDSAFSGPDLVPDDPKALGRMAQVSAIVDNYGYWPMIRQVFANRVFCSFEGRDGDEAEILEGMVKSNTVLDALEQIANEGLVLNGKTLTLADFHLAPMIAYFNYAPEGAEALETRSSLMNWWNTISRRKSMTSTDPKLPKHPP